MGAASLDGDFWNGYGVAFANPDGPQASLAFAFYQSVAGVGQGIDPRLANVTLTGHSLGAGLAGLVAGVYNRPGFFVDPMPFGSAVQVAYALSSAPLTPAEQAMRTMIYGNRTPWAPVPNANLFRAVGIPYADGQPSTNLLDSWRQDTASDIGSPFTYLDLPANTPLEWSTRNKVGQRHDGALIAIRMFADLASEVPTGDWKKAAQYFLPALFEEPIGEAIGAASRDGTPGGDRSNVLRSAIAYSAINEGERPFGDTGIRAMFNDATDLGRALGVAGVSAALRRSGDAIGQSLVQFAGQLALGDVEGDAVAKLGIVTVDAGLTSLGVDYSSALWAKGADSTRIVGREALLNEALARITLKPSGSVLPGVPQGFVPVSDIAAGLRWYQGVKGIALATPSELVDRVEFQIRETPFNGTLTARSTGSAANRLTAFVAGNGADRITGSASDHLIFGGDGNNWRSAANDNVEEVSTVA